MKKDCDQCGDCCYNEPLASMNDIHRMAETLDITIEEVLMKYISMRMRQKPNRACVAFVEKTKMCSIYPARPKICQEHFCEEVRG